MSWFSERLGKGVNRWRGLFGRPPIENGATRAMSILGGLAIPAGLSALGGIGGAAAGAGAGAGVGGGGFGAGVLAGGVPGAVGTAASASRWLPLLNTIMGNGGVGLISELLSGDPKLRTGSVPMTPEQRALYDWVLATLGPKPTQGMPTLSYLGPVIHQLLERFGNADFQMPRSVAIPGIPGSAGQQILGGAPFRPLDFTGVPKPWEASATPVNPPIGAPTGPSPNLPAPPSSVPGVDIMRTGQSMRAADPLKDALQTWILRRQMQSRFPGNDGPRYY
jgi:hypothetical protein